MDNIVETARKVRATKYQSEKRVHEVLQLIEKGHTYTEIIEICSTKLKWDLAERQIKKYIAKAQKLKRELPAEELDAFKVRKKLEHHYRKYVDDGNDIRAVAVLKELAKYDRQQNRKKAVKTIDAIDADTSNAYDILIEIFKEDADFRRMAHMASEIPEYGFVYTGRNISKTQKELIRFTQALLDRIPEEKIIRKIKEKELPEIQEFVFDIITNIKNTKI